MFSLHQSEGSSRSITPPALQCPSPGGRALAARGCQSAIWMAILQGQQCGLHEALIKQLMILHGAAGDHLRTLEDW